MLHLEQNKTNTLVLVCDDIITIADPVYLFRFVKSQGGDEYFIELENELTTNPRADRFTLILPTDLDLGTGDFRCYVYQSETPGDRDYENMLQLKSIKAEVKTTFEEDTTYETTGTDKVYQGNN